MTNPAILTHSAQTADSSGRPSISPAHSHPPTFATHPRGSLRTTLGGFAAIVMLAAPSHAQEAGPANLALVATPSASHVSGDTTVAALNDGNQPTSSFARHGGSFGNWPTTGTQWVQLEWSKPVSANAIEVYWWDDR